jgi:hypothetical protein
LAPKPRSVGSVGYISKARERNATDNPHRITKGDVKIERWHERHGSYSSFVGSFDPCTCLSNKNDHRRNAAEFIQDDGSRRIFRSVPPRLITGTLNLPRPRPPGRPCCRFSKSGRFASSSSVVGPYPRSLFRRFESCQVQKTPTTRCHWACHRKGIFVVSPFPPTTLVRSKSLVREIEASRRPRIAGRSKDTDSVGRPFTFLH